jgi:hypothetical protein
LSKQINRGRGQKIKVQGVQDIAKVFGQERSSPESRKALRDINRGQETKWEKKNKTVGQKSENAPKTFI